MATTNPEQAAPALIERTPGTVGGEARVRGTRHAARGTRLAVWGLVQWRRLGWSDADLLAAYPQLSGEALAAAWGYAAQHPDEIDRAIRANDAGANHPGILSATRDRDVAALAARIHQALADPADLAGQHVRVNRPSSP